MMKTPAANAASRAILRSMTVDKPSSPSPQGDSKRRAISPDQLMQTGARLPNTSAPAACRSPWLRLPTEVKLAIYEQFDSANYMGLALTDAQNYALARSMPGWHWKQSELRSSLDAAANFDDAVAVLVAHQQAIRAVGGPLQLPIDSPQYKLDAAHAVLPSRGQYATVIVQTLGALEALEHIPEGVLACLDLSYESEEVVLDFLDVRMPPGLAQVHLSGLSLGSYLHEDTVHELFGSSVREAFCDENRLGATVLLLAQGLEYLNIADNELTAARVERWQFPTSLKRLDLSKNSLGAVPNNLPPALRYLDLSETDLTGTDLLRAELPAHLRKLTLRGIPLSIEEYEILQHRLPKTFISV